MTERKITEMIAVRVVGFQNLDGNSWHGSHGSGSRRSGIIFYSSCVLCIITNRFGTGGGRASSLPPDLLSELRAARVGRHRSPILRATVDILSDATALVKYGVLEVVVVGGDRRYGGDQQPGYISRASAQLEGICSGVGEFL